jgi:hypothetical protein
MLLVMFSLLFKNLIICIVILYFLKWPHAHGQVLESYERAYNNMVRVQQLSELEEVYHYSGLYVTFRIQLLLFANKMSGAKLGDWLLHSSSGEPNCWWKKRTYSQYVEWAY